MEQNSKIQMVTPNTELASIMARYRQVVKSMENTLVARSIQLYRTTQI